MARLEGLEPPTFWFVAKHSIQLSYQRVWSIMSTHSLLTAQVSYHIFSENATPKFNFFARFLLFFILRWNPSCKIR